MEKLSNVSNAGKCFKKVQLSQVVGNHGSSHTAQGRLV